MTKQPVSSEMSLGDEVMKRSGELHEATEQLSKSNNESDIDAQEVGNWITTIGRALISIFK